MYMDIYIYMLTDRSPRHSCSKLSLHATTSSSILSLSSAIVSWPANLALATSSRVRPIFKCIYVCIHVHTCIQCILYIHPRPLESKTRTSGGEFHLQLVELALHFQHLRSDPITCHLSSNVISPATRKLERLCVCVCASVCVCVCLCACARARTHAHTHAQARAPAHSSHLGGIAEMLCIPHHHVLPQRCLCLLQPPHRTQQLR